MKRTLPVVSKLVLAWCLAITCVSSTFAQPQSIAKLPTATPESVGLNSQRLARIDEIVEEGLQAKKMPGCVVLVGRKGKIAYHKAFGYRQIEPSKVAMTKDTVFDMASITKPMATATSVMVLLEQGKIRLRDKVTTYIPEFRNGGKEAATVMHLLTHQAGFIPDNSVSDYLEGREKAFENIYALKAMYPPTEKFVYSDVGFILLDDLIERQSGMNVHEFSQKYIFGPLGMTETGYLPAKSLQQRAVTTEKRESRWMQGEVHDPRAYAMGGVAGHAGLFSTATDIAVYAQMMLQGGTYQGQRILSKATVDLMTQPYPIVEDDKTSIRGLGWDKLTGYSSNRGENMSPRAFGHGGFTGTILWMDPEHELFYVFLSNRVHPNGKGSVNHLGGRIATTIVGAIDDDLITDESTDNLGLKETADRPSYVRTSASEPKSSVATVRTGIDVLSEADFSPLVGQRVGLITNQTGITRQGQTTISALFEAKNVDLVALFSPEHGLAGKLDQSVIGDTVDGETALKVFSLYGASRKPTPEQLNSVDTLVFDIQDIGCRFYTYISTMGLAMEAASENGKKFVVLDRPNPIGGDFGGGDVDPGSESFVAFHSLPIRHGMTVGELAKMFKKERSLESLDLTVIPCDGWQRNQYFDQTGLQWVNPSPNMRNLNEAILYPGIGLWETTNISVGRGTDTPFEIFGAPWMDCLELAKALNEASIPGVKFTPRKFTPDSSKFANQTCEGVQISISDRDAFDPVVCGIHVATTLFRLYPDDWELKNANRLLVNQSTLDAIKAQTGAPVILEGFESDFLTKFAKRRAEYLIYQ